MRKRITKRVVDSLTPGDRDCFLWDTDLTGFGCKVTPAGRKIYVLQYRTKRQNWKGAPRRLTIGKHGELTPDQARKLAAELLLDLKAGVDPSLARRRSDSVTVSDLMTRFLEGCLPNKKRPPKASTLRSYDSLVRCHVLPALGNRGVSEVSTADLERLHRRMRATPYVANRTLSVLQHAFDQAEAWGWRAQATNPANGVERYPEQRRGARKEVMLTAKQMRALLKAIAEEEDEGADSAACAAIRVASWTGWRIGEVLNLEWDNLDLESGVARLVDTKTSAEEYRQIPTEVTRILAARGESPWL
jgi:integrase